MKDENGKDPKETFSTLDLFDMSPKRKSPEPAVLEPENTKSTIDAVLEVFPGSTVISINDVMGKAKPPKDLPDELCILGDGMVGVPSPDLANMLLIAGSCNEADPITHELYLDTLKGAQAPAPEGQMSPDAF